MPILETVVEANAGARIVPEAPDGSYVIQGGRTLRFRVQADSNLVVQVSGTDLPRRPQSTADSGWFEPTGGVLSAGSRGFFWDIAVELPARAVVPAVKDFEVAFAYDTFTTVQQPRLAATLHIRGRDAAFVAAMPRPSDVFVDNSDNTKPDNHMETSIAARGVTLAGWLASPGRNDGTSPRPTASEDWHYDLFLDPDFIERNYAGGGIAVEPVKSAALPGHVVPMIRGSATPIPLLSTNSAAPTSKPTAAAFTLAGMSHFVAELNAWHNWSGARGPRPSGWMDDPDPVKYPDNAWPFDPRKGTGNAGGSDLQAGDYVIVSGTLWQDSSHTVGGAVTDVDRVRKCFDDRFKGHGGYLEIHPLDAVRRVDPPSPRKHVVGMSACYPDRPDFDAAITHPQPPPGDTYALKFDVIVDDRFTTSNAVRAEVVDNSCPVPRLRVTANVPGTGSFNATYILWWEDTRTVQQRGTAICIPAIGPILGPVPP